MSVNIWWIRRDLRLDDNRALEAALDGGSSVIPTFILDAQLLTSQYTGEKRIAFLMGGLASLNRSLTERGSYLVIRRGKPVEQLAILQEETNAARIYAEGDISPFARRRDQAVGKKLPLELTDGLTILPPDMVLKRDGTPYTVFTPFSRRWKELVSPGALEIIFAPEVIQTPPGIPVDSLPDRPEPGESVYMHPGEKEAGARLQRFIAGHEAPILSYAAKRDRMDLAGTSELSPYLRFGMLSARQAAAAAMEKLEKFPAGDARNGIEVWLNELIWREFYMAILYHFPHVRSGSFRSVYDAIQWRNDESQFQAWCDGLTGYPVVDAGMRQLRQLGWMHNRARMVTASFLVKDLMIDWRWGERWFMQQLIDGDPAANNGGWQWTAGTGTDAAPYFRIFNPVSQGKKWDPDGAYVRRWLPELADLPTKYIHEPWKLSAAEQRQLNCAIGRDYPAPIVDHARARQVVLEAYSRAREQEQNEEDE